MNDTNLNNEKIEIDEPPVDILPEAGEVHTAHWHLFVPTVVIIILYVCGLIFLWMLGKSDGALARLFVIILTVGVPLLVIHALLRYNTSSVQLMEDVVRYHRGWPVRNPVDLPYIMLEKASVKRGVSGLLFGGGTLIMKLKTGDRISVPDLNDPDRVKELLQERLGPQTQSGKVSPIP